MRALLTMLLFCALQAVIAQQPYVPGSKISDFPVSQILNKSSTVSRFSSLQKTITILDFFGTWCLPCIKALPVLDNLQKSSPDKIAIILISIEETTQLESFIQKRKPFPFPIIVDEQQRITSLFKPPSYPYTVVLDDQGKILTVTEASLITKDKIDGWLAIKNNNIPDKSSDSTKDMQMIDKEIKVESKPILTATNNPLTELSRQFIYAAKTGSSTDSLIQQISAIPFDSLVKGLGTENEKKAFWINLYNGFTQDRLKKDPDQYRSRAAFFSAKVITVAGKVLSLDDIEHGILRRSSIKWSLGYLKKWFPSKKEKLLRVNAIDYRIHFSLNCGAKSCPPIASYDPLQLDKQLDIATKSYLTSEARYDAEKNILTLPAIMGWFRNDFGGLHKMRELLQRIGLVPDNRSPSIRFAKYDWNLYVNNYKN